MKIGIDGRFYNESGVGRYLRNLIEQLKVLDLPAGRHGKNNDYFIFLLPKDIGGFKETKNFKKIEANFNWYGFAEQFQFPKLLKKYNLDLMHFPHFNVPIFYPSKFVVTIHDLIHQHHSMKRATTLNPFTFKIKQIGYRRVFKHATAKSCKILVPSNAVRKLLEDEWRTPSSKIVVTPEAADDIFIKAAGKAKLNEPYIFYVGNAHPHKNVEGLIKAYLNLKRKHKDLKLVLAGGSSFFWERIKKDYTDKGIIYKGFVSEEELIALYKNAKCLVIPSFEEGFGLPLLEAFATNCPVVASNRASLPEVGGDAVLYFDPASPDDLSDKISKVLDTRLRKKLIKKGKERVKLFSWKELAKKTLEVYSQCV